MLPIPTPPPSVDVWIPINLLAVTIPAAAILPVFASIVAAVPAIILSLNVPIPWTFKFPLPEVLTPETVRLPNTLAPNPTVWKRFKWLLYKDTPSPSSAKTAIISSPAKFLIKVPPDWITKLPEVFWCLTIVVLPSCWMEKSEPVPTRIAAWSLKTNALSDLSNVIS